ncbi:UbiA family prenyltransferase [Chloroflexota bacterium]
MNIARYLLKFPEKIINSLEEPAMPMPFLFITFISIVTLRNFLEPLSTHHEIAFADFVHFYLFYFAIALCLIIVFHLCTGTPVVKVVRVILPGFIVLLLPPLFDLMITEGRGTDISYIFPELHGNLAGRFFTFFGHFDTQGISAGMKLEIALVLVGSFLYFNTKVKKLKIIRSILYTLLVYITAFFFLISPYVTEAITRLIGLEIVWQHEFFINYFASIILLAGVFTLYRANRQIFISLIKDSRPLRLLYYLSMIIVGVSLGYRLNSPEINCVNIFNLLFIPTSLAFAWLFSVMTNNMADYEIDRIASPGRPLTSSQVDPVCYRRLAWLFLLLALVYAMLVNFTTLFLAAAFISAYFIYSMPPFRLKRITALSKLVIALNSLVMIMLGYFNVTGTIENLPPIIFPMVLFGITLAANFIDIKDYQGDKAAGIKTLPVVMGLQKAKITAGLFFLMMYGLVYLVIDWLKAPIFYYYAFQTIGAVQCWLVIRKKYEENPVMIVILLSIILGIILIFRYGSNTV